MVGLYSRGVRLALKGKLFPTVGCANVERICRLTKNQRDVKERQKEISGFDSFEDKLRSMTFTLQTMYTPHGKNQLVYDELYSLALDFHDHFGGVDTNKTLSSMMKELLDLKK
jgi:hypothetical protein